MERAEPASPAPTPALSEAGQRLLVALLSIGDDDVAAVRARSLPRRRPRTQHGPTADYGTAAK